MPFMHNNSLKRYRSWNIGTLQAPIRITYRFAFWKSIWTPSQTSSFKLTSHCSSAENVLSENIPSSPNIVCLEEGIVVLSAIFTQAKRFWSKISSKSVFKSPLIPLFSSNTQGWWWIIVSTKTPLLTNVLSNNSVGSTFRGPMSLPAKSIVSWGKIRLPILFLITQNLPMNSNYGRKSTSTNGPFCVLTKKFLEYTRKMLTNKGDLTDTYEILKFLCES